MFLTIFAIISALFNQKNVHKGEPTIIQGILSSLTQAAFHPNRPSTSII